MLVIFSKENNIQNLLGICSIDLLTSCIKIISFSDSMKKIIWNIIQKLRKWLHFLTKFVQQLSQVDLHYGTIFKLKFQKFWMKVLRFLKFLKTTFLGWFKMFIVWFWLVKILVNVKPLILRKFWYEKPKKN